MTRQAKFVVRKSRGRVGAASRAWYFTLVGRNGETLATSELYTRKRDAVRGAGDAKHAAAEAVVEVAVPPRPRIRRP